MDIQVWPVFKKVGLFVVFISLCNLYISNSYFLRHVVNMEWASAYDRFSLFSPLLSVTQFNMHKPLTNTEANKMDFYLFLKKTKVSLLLFKGICPQKYVGLSNSFQRQCKAINLESENVILFMAFCIHNRLLFLWRLSRLKVFCFYKDTIMV